jgi:hypothetical protein
MQSSLVLRAGLLGEGAVQVLYSRDEYVTDPILAAVGQLQFEVVQYRMKDEYGVDTTMEPLPFAIARSAPGRCCGAQYWGATAVSYSALGRCCGTQYWGGVAVLSTGTVCGTQRKCARAGKDSAAAVLRCLRRACAHPHCGDAVVVLLLATWPSCQRSGTAVLLCHVAAIRADAVVSTSPRHLFGNMGACFRVAAVTFTSASTGAMDRCCRVNQQGVGHCDFSTVTLRVAMCEKTGSCFVRTHVAWCVVTQVIKS